MCQSQCSVNIDIEVAHGKAGIIIVKTAVIYNS